MTACWENCSFHHLRWYIFPKIKWTPMVEISIRVLDREKNMTTILLSWISLCDLTRVKNTLVQNKTNSDITCQAKYYKWAKWLENLKGEVVNSYLYILKALLKTILYLFAVLVLSKFHINVMGFFTYWLQKPIKDAKWRLFFSGFWVLDFKKSFP